MKALIKGNRLNFATKTNDENVSSLLLMKGNVI